MQNKFAIGIPTLNRFDLLYPACLFYLIDYPETKIYILDNGKQDIGSKLKHPNIEIIENDTNIGVANSFNKLCDIIYENHDYAMLLNDDIYLGRKYWEIDNLLTNFPRDIYLSTHDWCVIILPKKTYKKVGQFDGEFYPAYYEDNDYAYRMKLLKMNDYKVPFLNPFIFQASQTLEKAPEIRPLIENNKERYILKWGGLPLKETFATPFNQKK
jgi:GT2 family glycosyltransferase